MTKRLMMLSAWGLSLFLAVAFGSKQTFAADMYAACTGSPVTEDNRLFLSAAFEIHNVTSSTQYNLANRFRYYLDSTNSYNNGNNASCGLFRTQQDAQNWLDRSSNNARASNNQVINTNWSE
jgi:hypothetical protein